MSNNLSASSIMNNIILFVGNNLEENTNKDNIKVEKQNTRHVSPGTVDSDISFTHNSSGIVKNLFICNICDKPFDEKKKLRQHMLKHLKLHNCSFCGFKTSNKFILNAHIESKHTKKSAYICEHCSYKTHIKKYLIAHINSSHATAKINTKHLQDGLTLNSLNVHINAKHTRNISYKCSYCNFKTYQRHYLATHIDVKHTQHISYKCSMCSFITYQKTYLTKHMKMKHNKNTIYKCSLCAFTTLRDNYLASHINAKHTRDVSYNCGSCGFKAYQKSSLMRHVRVKHSKQKQR